ncbi:RDD family protein [Rhodococcus aerolatus]
MTGSWLGGDASLPPTSDEPQSHPGELLGLPAHGPGSLPGLGRRAAAVTLDWLMALAVAGLLPGGRSTTTLLVWAAVGVVAVALFAFTPGQLVMGIRVVAVPTPAEAARGDVVSPAVAVGWRRALVRSLLLAVVLPAIIMDRDGRGLQDRLSSTALVRSR